MSAVIFDYLVIKPAEFGLSNGAVVKLPHGTRIPGSEAENWTRAVEFLVSRGVIAPVPAEDGAEDAFYKAYPAVEASVEDEAVADDEPTEQTFPHHTGFGNFALSDGSTVKGKQAALQAQAALDGAYV